MNNPLISVIIPCHNSEKTISQALDSIIKQTYKNIEIIVVDDNSTDQTRKIVEDIQKNDSRIKYLTCPNDSARFDRHLNKNINAGYLARNTGLKNSNGELITFQDADDVSLTNRIEIQLALIEKYKADHLVLDNFPFDKKFIGRKIDLSKYLTNHKVEIFGPEEIYRLSQKNKGLIAKFSVKLNSLVPFFIKRKRIINKLFFGSLDPYPYSGNYPLFKKKIIEKVIFRKLSERIWPSFMGRGADRDFNFQVAETFRNSYALNIPLYMWDTRENALAKYPDIENYII